MDDPRKEFSIIHLYMAGGRMLDVYTKDDAVQDYMKMHPDAREADVRAELDRELKKVA